MTDIKEQLATLVKSIPQPFKEHARAVRASVLSHVEQLERELKASEERYQVALEAAHYEAVKVVELKRERDTMIDLISTLASES